MRLKTVLEELSTLLILEVKDDWFVGGFVIIGTGARIHIESVSVCGYPITCVNCKNNTVSEQASHTHTHTHSLDSLLTFNVYQ